MIKKIKTLSYEDNKKPLYIISGGRKEVLERILNHIKYEEIPEVYEFIKTIDMEKFHNLEIAVEIGDYEFQSIGVK